MACESFEPAPTLFVPVPFSQEIINIVRTEVAPEREEKEWWWKIGKKKTNFFKAENGGIGQ